MHEALYYNALARAMRGDRGKMKKLYETRGGWERAYRQCRGGGGIFPDPKKEWAALERSSMRLILLGAPDFPPLLKEIPDPPFGIYVRGALPPPEKIPFAIIGTRKATDEGKMAARRFAGALSKRGFAIISGLAFGIDAAAHAGCLDAGGATAAVLASGADVIAPRTNLRLAERILENGGAIVSEYPPESEALPYRFLERNRIISGLSKGVLVIEAPEMSGALATARFAAEQNRDAFAVPGPAGHPNFIGSHHLIRNGATLAAQPEHIMEAYGVARTSLSAAEEAACAPEERSIIAALRACAAGADVDKIAAMAKLEPRTANQALSFLVIKEIIEETAEGYKIKSF